jgi:sugar-specific transcriptional regulator TrmB
MLDTLRSHLGSAGLSDKEANIYLALLQTGSATPQVLAERTKVNRSTAYLALASLQKRGLVSSVEARGKQCFVAEPPDRLTRLVDEAVRKVEEGRSKIMEALPSLVALFQVADPAPRVRFFEGANALQAAREEIWATRAPISEIFALDEDVLRIAAIKEEERIKLTQRIRGGRALVAIKPGLSFPPRDPASFEIRLLDYHRCPFRGSLFVAGHKMCVITTHAEGMGIMINHPEITAVFQALFESAWATAKPHSP